VFLRVLRDACFVTRASDLLLPRVDLSALWPDRCGPVVVRSGVDLRLRTRVETLAADEGACGAWSTLRCRDRRRIRSRQRLLSGTRQAGEPCAPDRLRADHLGVAALPGSEVA
jgi:hypothetical protein